MQSKIVEAQKILSQKNSNPNRALKLLTPLIQDELTPWQAYHLYGMAMLKKRDFSKAFDYLKRAIYSGSEEHGTYHGLAVAAYNLKKFEEAETFAEKSVEIKNDHFGSWMILGDSRRELRKLNESLLSYQKCNQIDPKSVDVAYKIAQIYRDQGFGGKALEMFDIAIQMNRTHLGAINEKAKILTSQRRYEEALETIESGLNHEPDNIVLQSTCAELKKEMGEYTQALSIYEDILKKHPEYGGIRVNYANILQDLGRFDEAEENYLQANKDFPALMESFSNYLFVQHYNPAKSREEIFEAHKKWDSIYAPENPVRPKPKNIDKAKKLRVGLISGGFRKHPVGWMITPGLEKLNQNGFELYFYSNFNQVDEITKKLHAVSSKWHMISGLDDEQLNQLIRNDNIDILIDLSGHAAESRLRSVAMEPAPVIVKWVGGLINTTGLKAIDFLISDSIETPNGVEPFYLEKLIRMPDDYICFNAPEYAPEVSESPFKSNGYITFGCFNNPTKVNEEILKYWAEIMAKVSDSRLLLKSKQYGNNVYVDRIRSMMAKYGIEAERLIFEGLSPHTELLDTYNRVDIALDPWPYSGGLTTCEALWMGVPVITRPGDTFAGRHSATHLHNAGCSEWIANNFKEYISKAVELANDDKELAKVRSELRSRVANSPLCDSERFAKHLGKALRTAWIQRVEGYENGIGSSGWSDHINVESEVKKSKSQISRLKPHQQVMQNGSVNKIHRGKEPRRFGTHDMDRTHGDVEMDIWKIETKDEVVICTPPDLKILTPYVLLEKYDWYDKELQFVRDFIKPGMNVTDVGAGFGVYTLPMAKTVGPNGKVFAFEPGSVCRKYLKMSIMENGFENTAIFDKAISKTTSEQLWLTTKTPELDKIDESGNQKISTVNLDTWWEYDGRPEMDLLKIDTNGHDLEVIEGAKKLIENENPVLLISTAGVDLNLLTKSLSDQGYNLFEYISDLGILVESDLKSGIDPYSLNILAVHESQLDSFKKAGWIYDETVNHQTTGSDLWKTELANLPWTHEKMSIWENQGEDKKYQQYFQALNYLVQAEKIDVFDSDLKNPGSQKAVLMFSAAQILIELYNQGVNSTSVVFTLVRALNALGKRGQAVDVMQKLIETTKFGQENMNMDLPFMLPLYQQDRAPVKTDFSKWLMVRTIEAWIQLKDITTYLSGLQEQKLIEVLDGNPEVVLGIKPQISSGNLSQSGVFTDTQKTTSNGKPPNINKFNKLNKVVLVLSGKNGGAHGIHVKFANKLSEGMNKLGIHTETVFASSGDFLRKVIQASEEPGTGIYTGPMGFDLRVQADLNLQGNFFDVMGKRAVGYLGDHPYTQFMWSRMHYAGNNITFITACTSIKNEFHNIYGDKNEIVVLDKLPAITNNHEIDRVPEIKDREIDLLIPLGLHKHLVNQDVISKELTKFENQAEKIGLKVYEKALNDYQKNILEIFIEEYLTVTGNEYKFQGIQRKEDQLWLSVLSTVDWHIRKERRLKLLNGLGQIADQKKVVITASPEVQKLVPELKGKKIEWIGEVDNDHLDRLYLQSKQVLNSNPTYPDGVHGRIRSAMISGASVISDYAPSLEKVFGSDEAISFTGFNGDNLADYIDRHVDDIQQIASKGRAIIKDQFSLQDFTRRLLTVIEKTLNYERD